MTERKVTICTSCNGVPENSIMGIMIVKMHGEDLVRLGIAHSPECPELEPEKGVQA